MKRLLLIILSVFLLAGIVYAKGVYYYPAETVSGCDTVADSYAGGDDVDDQKVGYSTSSDYVLIRWQANASIAAICKIEAELLELGTITADKGITLELWSDSAGAPGSRVANGLSDTTFDTSDLTGSYQYIPFLFSSKPSITLNTYYWIMLVVAADGDLGDTSNCMVWKRQAATGDAQEKLVYDADGAAPWDGTAEGRLCNFKIYE